ncbi:MAG: hypothetical protein KIH63_001950 [Candidatus Saccharibacteria bacterium]|nr:hypothetical protein [Candidatus Saccharibacteria bacterium]
MARYYQHLMLNGPLGVQAANIAAHAAERLELGTIVVITKEPTGMVLSLTKAWQKNIQVIKQKRDLATDTDEKLRLTHRLIKLQSTHIGTSPQSHIVVCSQAAEQLPVASKSVYLANVVPDDATLQLISSIPSGLVIGSLSTTTVRAAGLLPKSQLDAQADAAWQAIGNFLNEHTVSHAKLARPHKDRFNHINAALESLLDETTAREFISLMNDFHMLAKQAMPLDWDHHQIRRQQTLAVLAAQVATYTPGITTVSLADNEDPLFYLSDQRVQTTLSFWDQFCRGHWPSLADRGTPALAGAGLA